MNKPLKRKNCSGTKGYNCGQTCISKSYECKIEISGQSISIITDLEALRKAANGSGGSDDSSTTAPTLTRDKAKETMKFLGAGISGEVYADGDKAYKFEKKIDDNDTAEARNKAMANARLLGELGVGPKIGEIKEVDDPKSTQNGKGFVTPMEYLQGYEAGFSDNGSLLKVVKAAHENNILLDDFHEENVMHDPETGDVKAIDQGDARKGEKHELAEQLLDNFSWRPMIAETVDVFIQDNGTGKQRSAFKKIKKRFNEREGDELSGTKPMSNEEVAKLYDETMSILNEIGV